MPRLASGRGSNPVRTVRIDPVQSDWVEAYASTHDVTFSSMIRLAITRFTESELMKVDNFEKLFEALDWQTRKLEAIIFTNESR